MEKEIAKREQREIPQLWSSISHEIRTPLNVIMGMTDISENEIYDIEQMKKCFYRIKESTQNMLQVVDALVDYAAITQDEFIINSAKFDFKTLITDIAMQAYLASQEKNCHFNIHIQNVSEELLAGDEARVSQMLIAMLGVVIRHTASEGSIDFTVQQTSVSNGKVFMRFVLRSNALLLPEEIAEYLKKNAKSIDPRLLSPVGTFGLAEINALHIAHLMGGKIRTDISEEYSEIMMDISFGKIDNPDACSGAKLFSKQRILIVADTEQICNERGRMLTDMGMKYDIATEAEEALNRIGEAENEKKPFSICIIDWSMQNIKSTKLIKEIRNIFGQGITILAAAHDPERQWKAALHFGANYVIDRTIFRSTLFDALVSIEKGIQIKNHENTEQKYDFQGKRILVAEDVALNMEVITKLLSRVNIAVTCVENGMEAVTQFEKKPEGYFHAILLDINMPVMDGYEAARTIRKSQKKDGKSVPIYAMTANAFKEDVEDALAAGMDGHIAKPIDVNSLYSILKNALSNSENDFDRELKKKASELEQENRKLRDWAEHDPLTGCLNRHGFDIRLEELLNESIPVAYLIIDLDNFKNINDRFGHEIGDKILVKITKILMKKFRSTDYFVRFGGDEFVVLLKGFKNQNSFIIHRVEEINDELLHPNDNLPPITISVGAAVAPGGYTPELYSNADKALYHAKNTGKNACVIYDDEDKEIEEEQGKQLYAEEIYYMDNTRKVIVEKKQMLHSLLLAKNKSVAYMAGYYEEGFPIYSMSGFILDYLGYTFEEFQEAAIDGLVNFVHSDDVKYLLKENLKNELWSSKLRLRHKRGDYIWFNMEYVLTNTLDEKPFWMASLRSIEDNLVGALCSDDYWMVSIIDPDTDSIIIEKGVHILSKQNLHVQKKYNYTNLIECGIKETVRESEREGYILKASLKNVIEKIKLYGMYEFVIYQKWNATEYHAVRHKFRFLSDRENTILSTWEILDQWAEADELTDVLNEKGFYRRVGRILEEHRDSTEYAIVFFDISGFKAWNSTLGKENADKLLKITAQTLLTSQLNPLAIGRMFSDHFACFVRKDELNLKVINELCDQRLEMEDSIIPLRMRCGIFNIQNPKESIRSMCDRAKLAQSFVENEHAVPYFVFDDAMNEKYIQQMQVLNNLGGALNKNEIKVFYQPIINTKTKEIVSAEALIRWILPGNLIVSPGVFLPVLEERGHISDVDSYAQKTVCDMLERRAWRKQRIVPVSVNMSRMDFLNAEFVNKLKGLVTTREIAKNYFSLEVTESSCVEIGNRENDLLQYLKSNGIKIIMDDFGTGYSSLANLTNQRFDVLKIDMSFIRDIGKKQSSEAIIKSIITMCHHLELKVVAEGVETQEQYKFLRDMECDYIQGYYFYKPMPEEEFEKLLDGE